jgi:hypothetical protein
MPLENMSQIRREIEMIESDLTAAERLKSYLEASELARMNAETAREMSVAYEDERETYSEAAYQADLRRLHYLKWAREMEVIVRRGDAAE